MIQKKIIKTIFILIITVSAAFGQVSFKASSEKVVSVGEQFRLTFEVNAKGSNFRPPDLSAFKYSGPSTSSSSRIEMINGKTTRTATYSFVYFMQAKKTGKFKIGPAQIKVNKKIYKSNPITIEVVKGNTAQSSSGQSGNDLFVRLDLSKTQAYVGEQIFASVKIYSRQNLAGFEDSEFPSYSGFWTQSIETPNQISLERQNVNGTIYNVGEMKKDILFAQRTGEITIDPVKLTCIVRKKVRPKSFFDMGYRDMRVQIQSKPRKVKILPLPGNKPTDFSGAVGHFNMSAVMDKQQVKTNDAISLVIKVSGNGNIKLIEPLDIVFPHDFDTYKPEIDVSVKNTNKGAYGTKSFKYLLIPRHAGDFSVPPIRFSYFDTQSRSYKTITSKKFDIHVEKGNETTPATAQFYGNDKTDVKTLDFDIRYLKVKPFQLLKTGHFFTGTLTFYLVYLGAFVIFIIVFLIRRKQVKEASNVMLLKNRRASKISRQRLKKAHTHLKHKNKEPFYNEVLKAIWGYLSDKLGIPVADLTRDNVVETLKQNSIDEGFIKELTDILDACEYAKYAPSAEEGAMGDIYTKAGKIISKLSQNLK